MINRKFFFDQVRGSLFGGSLKQPQVDGLSGILDEWEKHHAKADDRWLAYMLATTHHETDRTMRPIREYGKGKGKKYGVPDPQTGHVYYGRGFVQLTWKDNYVSLGKDVGVDLVNNPDRALDLPIATKILFVGMIEGRFGRYKSKGKVLFYKLSDFFNKSTDDWIGARRIVNIQDKAHLIASYGKSYYAAISYTTG